MTCRTNIEHTYHLLLRYIAIILFCLLTVQLSAQPDSTNKATNNQPVAEVNNPFEIGEGNRAEIKPRTPPVIQREGETEPTEPTDEKEDTPQLTDEQIIKAEQNIEYDKENPFELSAKKRINHALVKPTEITDKPAIKTPGIFDSFKAENFNATATIRLTALLFMLILLAFVSTVYQDDLTRTIRGFTNGNMLLQLHRERGNLFSLPHVSLYLLFFLSAGTLIFLLADFYQIPIVSSPFAALILCIGSVMGIYLGKHLLLNLVGGIFPVDKDIEIYNFMVAVFNQILGLVLIPFVALLAFGPEEFKVISVYGAVGLAALIYIFRAIRGLFIAEKYLSLHKFHFILYLCTIEIAPIVILFKIITTWG